VQYSMPEFWRFNGAQLDCKLFFQQLSVISAVLKALRKILIRFEFLAARAEIIRAVSLVSAIGLSENEYLRRVVLPKLPYRHGQQLFFNISSLEEGVSVSSLAESFATRMHVLQQLGQVQQHVRACIDMMKSVARLAAVAKGHDIRTLCL